MIRQAVILAAGMGCRLRDVAHQGPKGLLQLGAGPSLVERSMSLLRRAGMHRIVIITGHEAARYRHQIGSHPGVELLHNPGYANSGSGGSLAVAAHALTGPFLLLESDVAFEYRALSALLEDGRENLILAGRSPMHDKVYVRLNEFGFLSSLEKGVASAALACGELTGLTKISDALRVSLAAWRPVGGGGWDYEQALVALAPRHHIRVLVRPELLWFEVDDAAHYERACAELWPALQQRDLDEAAT